MNNTQRQQAPRSVQATKGMQVKTNVRAGVTGSFNSRDSYGSAYGTY